MKIYLALPVGGDLFGISRHDKVLLSFHWLPLNWEVVERWFTVAGLQVERSKSDADLHGNRAR